MTVIHHHQYCIGPWEEEAQVKTDRSRDGGVDLYPRQSN